MQLGYFAVISVAVVLSILSIVLLRGVVKSKDTLIYQRVEKLVELKSLELLVKQKVARNRGISYTLTGDSRFLDELGDLDQQFDTQIKTLRTLLNSRQGRRQIDAIEQAAIEHDNSVAYLLALRASKAPLSKVLNYFETDVRPRSENLNNALSKAIAVQQWLYKEGVRRSESADNAAMDQVQAAGSVALILTIGLIILFARTMRALRKMISSQAEARVRIENSEREFRAIFEASGVGISQMCLKTRKFIRVNDGFCEILGYSREDLLDKYPHEITHPDDVQSEKIAFENMLRGNQKSHSVHKRYIRNDGKVVWVNFNATVCHRDEHNNPTSTVATVVDITDSKNFEASLEKAKEAAEEANRAKSWFLANVSHEIRSPMSSVLGYADLLTEKSNISEAEKLMYIQRIKTSGEHLLRLINDILDLSKVEAGQIKVDILKFNVADLVEECLEALSVIAQGKGVALSLNIKENLPPMIYSDPVRLRQILVNLIGNAIKFTPNGQVIVRIALESANKNPTLAIDVEDTGIGISKENQAELFRPFTQGDASVTRKFGGTGLGLHLSKRLAEILSGSLNLAWSEPNKGSCFTIRIPVEIAEHTVPEQKNPPPKAEPVERENSRVLLQGMNVLLVDDSPDNQILMRIFLENSGAHVALAKDGKEAIKKALHGTHDLVLMDVMMPLMDGLEATRRLRKANYTKPIIAVSAHALREEIDRSLAAGCNDHLTKPISCAKLISTVRRYQPKRISATTAKTHA